MAKTLLDALKDMGAIEYENKNGADDDCDCPICKHFNGEDDPKLDNPDELRKVFEILPKQIQLGMSARHVTSTIVESGMPRKYMPGGFNESCMTLLAVLAVEDKDLSIAEESDKAKEFEESSRSLATLIKDTLSTHTNLMNLKNDMDKYKVSIGLIGLAQHILNEVSYEEDTRDRKFSLEDLQNALDEGEIEIAKEITKSLKEKGLL